MTGQPWKGPSLRARLPVLETWFASFSTLCRCKKFRGFGKRWRLRIGYPSATPSESPCSIRPRKVNSGVCSRAPISTGKEANRYRQSRWGRELNRMVFAIKQPPEARLKLTVEFGVLLRDGFPDSGDLAGQVEVRASTCPARSSE